MPGAWWITFWPGLAVMVGLNRRFDPSFAAIRTRVQAGDIGTPHIAGPGLTHVEHLSNLRLLTFWNSALTDAAYQHLREMKSLWELFLGRTQVTPETIEKLKRDLPNCALVL